MKKVDPKTISAPKPEEVPALVDRAKELRAQIADLSHELKVIEVKLAKHAQSLPHERLQDDSREGRRVALAGNVWRVPVIFTSDELIKSFQADSPKHKELLRILGDEDIAAAKTLLERFFSPPSKWETKFDDGQKFRAAAAEWLSPEVAPKFIAACRQTDKNGLPKSKTVINLDDAERIKEVAS
jgi:hypothetical protein